MELSDRFNHKYPRNKLKKQSVIFFVPIKLQYFTSPIDRQTYTGQVSFFSAQQAEKRGVAVAEQRRLRVSSCATAIIKLLSSSGSFEPFELGSSSERPLLSNQVRWRRTHCVSVCGGGGGVGPLLSGAE